MSKISKNEQGFSGIEILMVVVIVALIGAVGYMVYKNKHQPAKVVTVTKTVVTPVKAPVTDNLTANWTNYNSAAGKFSLKYPSTWVTATNPDVCSPGLLLLGANSSSVGKCGSSSFGQMTVSGESERAACGGLNPEAWNTTSSEKVIVSGVSGTKTTGVAINPVTNQPPVGEIPDGTQTIQYCFNDQGMTYVADYTQLSTYPDVLSDFNLMVTKTLQFN